MNAKHDARAALAYLEELCGQLQQGRRLHRTRQTWWQAPVVASAALTFAAMGPACGGEVTDESDEICDNAIDDDGDGDVDCADGECQDFAGCQSALYAAPVDEICDNAIDDDGNGDVDCADEACAGDPSCVGLMYAAPAEICDNGIDDDYDEAVDCDDEDCLSFSGCMGALYAAPAENCDNGVDDDYDEAIDCDDEDCLEDPACVDGALYAAPS